MVHPRAKVTIDSRYEVEVVCEESTCTKMNDLDLCFEVVQCHVYHCVTFGIEYLENC